MASAGIDIISLAAGTSPATASTSAKTGSTGFSVYDRIEIVLESLGATNGVLDVYIQTSQDGTNWYDCVHFTQIPAGAAAAFQKAVPGLPNLVVAIGKGTTPALAATTCTGGFLDQLRVVYVAGASTSAGAAQTVTVFGHFTANSRQG